MEVSKAVKFLPFAFALHNIEEARAICNNDTFTHNPLVASAGQFVIAVSLFTVLGLTLVFGKKLYPDFKTYQAIIAGFSGMLFLNAFFPHIFSAIYFKMYTPGLISALVLTLPLSGVILWKIFKSRVFSVKQLILIILAGGVMGILLVVLFLGMGYLIAIFPFS